MSNRAHERIDRVDPVPRGAGNPETPRFNGTDTHKTILDSRNWRIFAAFPKPCTHARALPTSRVVSPPKHGSPCRVTRVRGRLPCPAHARLLQQSVGAWIAFL